MFKIVIYSYSGNGPTELFEFDTLAAARRRGPGGSGTTATRSSTPSHLERGWIWELEGDPDGCADFRP